MPHFHMFEIIEMPHLLFQNRIGKNGHFKISQHIKWSISKNSHVINFKTEKEPKMNLFDFGAFQKIMQMLSHDKIIFHMLLGAFHDTPRNGL